MAEDTALVAAYLAERHVPCPACGYDLCGVKAPSCPECGCGVHLQIERTGVPPLGRAEWSSAFAVVLLGAVLSAISWALSVSVGGMPLSELGPWILLGVPLVQLLASLHLLRHLRRAARFRAAHSPRQP